MCLSRARLPPALIILTLFSLAIRGYSYNRLLHFTFLFVCRQLELCGGLTPILERSTRESCDDSESHSQVTLLAEEAEANACNLADNNVHSYYNNSVSSMHSTQTNQCGSDSCFLLMLSCVLTMLNFYCRGR